MEEPNQEITDEEIEDYKKAVESTDELVTIVPDGLGKSADGAGIPTASKEKKVLIIDGDYPPGDVAKLTGLGLGTIVNAGSGAVTLVEPGPRKLLGTIISHEGKFKVYEQDGKHNYVGEPEVTWEDFPDGWKTKHLRVFNTILVVVARIQQSDRSFPITREELVKLGAKKKTLKDLVDFGMIGIESTPLIRDNKNTGNRTAVYFTAKGFAYIKTVDLEAKAKVADSAGSGAVTTEVPVKSEA